MQFNNNPLYAGMPQDIYTNNGFQQSATNPYGYINPQQQMTQQQMPIGRPAIDPRNFETPKIIMGESHKPMFSVVKEDGSSGGNAITVSNEPDVKRERRGRKKKQETVDGDSIIKVDATPVGSNNKDDDTSTIYSYGETNRLLHDTLGQIDAINGELIQEFNSIRHSRTMKNKHMVLNNLSENIGSLISNRIAAIREINNCITKANDLDYKKYKDIQAAQSAMNDDKYIADLYQAYISQPAANLAPQYQMPQLDQSILGSGIVRATINSNDLKGNGPVDAGYLSYVANLTPEQNAMRYEGNPNIKQCVIFDAATGAKYFQMMDMSKGEAIPNMPVYDQMFMEDTTLDVEKGIAKNINLNETFPIIVLNGNTTNQY